MSVPSFIIVCAENGWIVSETDPDDNNTIASVFPHPLKVIEYLRERMPSYREDFDKLNSRAGSYSGDSLSEDEAAPNCVKGIDIHIDLEESTQVYKKALEKGNADGVKSPRQGFRGIKKR